MTSINTDYTGDDKLSNNNNKDYWCLVQEVQHYGDEAADLQANKTTLAPAGYDWVVQDAYDLQKKGESGGIITPIFSKAVQATTEYSADLNSLWQEAWKARKLREYSFMPRVVSSSSSAS